MQSLAVGTLGPVAAMTAAEQMLIVPPATRMLARMDEAQLGRYAQLADPLVLLAGLAIYATRVATAVSAQRKAARAADAAGSVAPPAERPTVGQPSAAAAPPPPQQIDRAPSTNGQYAPIPAAIAAAVDDLEGS